ncbi:MAG: putative lipid II flippase FtsW [Cyanobacteria bacterium REEB67]|nr:putative lipid II flippase FtsW [Cyanobacteria bacterium REEB67]
MSSKILSAQEQDRWRRRSSGGSARNSDSTSVSPSTPEFRGAIDRTLVGVVLSLCGFGLMAVYSASAPEAQEFFQDSTALLRKQTIFFVIGIFAMFTISRYDYRKIKKFAWPLAIISLVLLCLTMVPGLSVTTMGSSRWLSLGPLQFQPSEMCKVATIILLSSGLSKYFWWHRQILCRLVVIMLMAGIVIKQPDLGTASMILSSLLVLIFASGTNFVLLGGSIVGGFILVWHHIQKTPYQMARIETWLNPYLHPQKEGWNIIQAQYAISAGGIWGLGFGRSLQKLYYLPVQHADFIFAVVAEEFGLVGCSLIVGLFALLGFHGFKTALAAKTLFGRFLAIGITSAICTQAMVNMMVTTGLVPVTGITLPFISYGGTSIVITLSMVGILLSVSRDRGVLAEDEDNPDFSDDQPSGGFA